MSWWRRITNVFRAGRVSREIDEELETHIQEAIEQGRDPLEARRAFGSSLRRREESRDIRLIPWLESIGADIVFGWRQLTKKKITSAAAILSMALAIGACTSAFRLIDAILLRPLPIQEPERLYALTRVFITAGGNPQMSGCSYPLFRFLRNAAKDHAELIAISNAIRVDVTYGSEQEMEKAYRQHVSGWMFQVFGLQPALGRLFTEDDDRTPGAHPVAVLSHDYWTRRFAQDPSVLGRRLRTGNELYEIIGVAEKSFTGTEPGTMTDIFIPSMMNPAVESESNWFQTFVRHKGGSLEPARQRLQASLSAWHEERNRGSREERTSETVLLEPAAAGLSGLQRSYRLALLSAGVLVGLVLLIACANVANLMTAQTAARAREFALRVAIGAGRSRLVQLVLVESAWVALLSTALGGLFAWWSAPFVAGMINPPDNPVRLVLPVDWRLVGFGAALAITVTFLFGLAPALRASGVKPDVALKGGHDSFSRRRLMYVLVSMQVAFCFLVHFVAGLFVATFDRLSNQPTGFSADRVVTLETVAASAQPPAVWEEAAGRLRAMPGVEAVALAGWPLMSGNFWRDFISLEGEVVRENRSFDDVINFLAVSPGWLEAMRIPLLSGRDFRPGEIHPSAAIVNEAFAKRFFGGRNAVGRHFEKDEREEGRVRVEIVGVVRNAHYRSLRQPMSPAAYFPWKAAGANGALQPKRWATFIVRTTGGNPLTLAAALRQEVSRARPELRVSEVRPQAAFSRAQTVRERLLATLAVFFAIVSLLLAGVGLYGVLDYSVLQRRREIGIRMAIGAGSGDIARRVLKDTAWMAASGAIAGLALGLGSVRYIESLLYGVTATSLETMTLPPLTVLVAALAAAVPPVIRALRIDPAALLRTD